MERESKERIHLRLEKECFPQPGNIQEKVWRYMTFDKFKWLLENHKLWLARADTMQDKYECALPTKQSIEKQKFLLASLHEAYMKGYAEQFGESLAEQKFQENQHIFNTVKDQMLNGLKDIQKLAFISCWTLGKYESDALWKIYCADTDGGYKNGIAIQSNYEKLYQSIKYDPDLYLGKIKYIDYQEGEVPGYGVQHIVMHKSKYYGYENEVRIFKLHATFEEHLLVDWDYKSCLESIVISPYSDGGLINSVIQLLETHNKDLIPIIRPSDMLISPSF